GRKQERDRGGYHSRNEEISLLDSGAADRWLLFCVTGPHRPKRALESGRARSPSTSRNSPSKRKSRPSPAAALIPERLPSCQAVAAHQGREQDTLDLIMEPQVLVGVLDAFVVEPVWWIVFEVTHLVNHPRGFFLFAYIEAAGD